MDALVLVTWGPKGFLKLNLTSCLDMGQEVKVKYSQCDKDVKNKPYRGYNPPYSTISKMKKQENSCPIVLF